jgi:guanylate kinase
LTEAEPTPLLVVISGPSGVGKDTIIERMSEIGHNHHFTVTATTRAPRPGEVEGVNHHFLSREEFQDLIRNNGLLEWAEVYGNYYGVPRQQVRDALASGRHVIIRVDVQGAKRVKELAPEALLIFIMPPSLDALRSHLATRGVNSGEEMEQRMESAEHEMRQAQWFDYTVVNHEDELDIAVRRVTEIIRNESLRVPPRLAAI